MIRINNNKGFHLTFDNGLTISVQIGNGNYCDNRSYDFDNNEMKQSVTSCVNAEIAIWDKNNQWFAFGDGDTVKGWVSVEEVGIWIDKVRRAKSIKSIKRVR